MRCMAGTRELERGWAIAYTGTKGLSGGRAISGEGRDPPSRLIWILDSLVCFCCRERACTWGVSQVMIEQELR